MDMAASDCFRETNLKFKKPFNNTNIEKIIILIVERSVTTFNMTALNMIAGQSDNNNQYDSGTRRKHDAMQT
jgi:hypothetical protein